LLVFYQKKSVAVFDLTFTPVDASAVALNRGSSRAGSLANGA
jgi:hypothetical protein